MDAGRELDVLVAERVFGAKVWDRDGVLWMTRHHPHQVLPSYSANIAAAWQVVEHLKQRGLCVKTETWPNRPAEASVLFDHGREEWIGHISYADTAPRAICHAALAAVGAEVPA